jgi:hypothetical protein
MINYSGCQYHTWSHCTYLAVSRSYIITLERPSDITMSLNMQTVKLEQFWKGSYIYVTVPSLSYSNSEFKHLVSLWKPSKVSRLCGVDEICSSETSADLHRITRSYMTENRTPHRWLFLTVSWKFGQFCSGGLMFIYSMGLKLCSFSSVFSFACFPFCHTWYYISLPPKSLSLVV